MSILFPESSNNNFILSLKIILISTSVLSAAVALKLSVPAITDFAVTEVPSIYNGVVSWLRPPYLYLVINCIIITIVASSKLQSKLAHGHVAVTPLPTPPPQLQTTPVQLYHHQQHDPVPVPLVVPLAPIKQHDFNDVVLKDEVVDQGVALDLAPPKDVFEYSNLNNYEDNKALEEADALPEVEMNGYGDEPVMAKSSWSSSPSLSRTDSLELSYSNEKPPVSARFGHRRAVKATPEGGKAALGVSKPKRQDTLESTWKTITEGRAMPLTRHLRKSDTWETHGGRHRPNQAPQNQKVIKSETFTDRSKTKSNGIGSTGSRKNDNNNHSLLSPSPGSGKLKREPSLSQDELNRRVEAFIKKFNEEMRLQRQESLNQYREMIDRGAH